MPVFRNNTAFEMWRGVRAFFRLEAGLTRGATPGGTAAPPARQARGRQPARAPGQVQGPNQAVGVDAAALRKMAGGPYGVLAEGAGFEPLRIVHVALDDGGGGGARAARWLSATLRRLGHDSTTFVARKRTKDPTVRAFEPSDDPANRAARKRRREDIQAGFERYEGSRPRNLVGYGFTGDRGVHGAEPVEQLPSCDVVNLHWFGDFLDYRAFFSSVPEHTPVVWTLHDMNAFTGGCHWDAGCGRFAKEPGCGACPQLGSRDETDLSREIWRRKKEAFDSVREGQLNLVSPSRWLARKAWESSLLGGFPTSVIPLSLDTQTFSPRHRALARSALDIPPEAAVLLFVADSLVTVRKGFHLLAEALEGLSDVPNLFLLSLGANDPGIVEKVPHRHLGYVKDDLVLSAIYSAADVYVIPSLQDNMPQTVLEAMACGTPVVGLDTGGIPDMVRPGVTGELVPLGSDAPAALRGAVSALLRDPQRRAAFSANCRRVVVEEYAPDLQAGRYVELYRSMLASKAAGA